MASPRLASQVAPDSLLPEVFPYFPRNTVSAMATGQCYLWVLRQMYLSLLPGYHGDSQPGVPLGSIPASSCVWGPHRGAYLWRICGLPSSQRLSTML